jgi:hypothetical protein
MLTLLLDEHINWIVADQVKRKDPVARIASIRRWNDGEFLHTADEIILEAAFQVQTTLVTFDQSTIRRVLKDWGDVGRPHGGVIFIDEKSIAPNDYGSLVKALLRVWNLMHSADFTDVVLFLQPDGR